MATQKNKQNVGLVAVLLFAFAGINLSLAVLSSRSEDTASGDFREFSTVISGQQKAVKSASIHSGLAKSNLPQLQKLAQYEKNLGFGFEEAMFFARIPINSNEAETYANSTATALEEFSKYGITPFVIFEPQDLNLEEFESAPVKEYFANLNELGINNDSIGVWAPFPEPNIPEWSDGEDKGNTDPNTFKKNYMQTASDLKAEFPQAKTVLLLNAATYKSGDVEYQQGPDYSEDTLRQYVEGLPRDLVDEAALQGFPWAPNDFEPDGGYMDADLAVMLGRKIGTDKIRMVTGTFSRMYDTQLAPQARKIILDGILSQARQVQQAGFKVQFDIFAEDKFDQPENADWSYGEGLELKLLKEFVDQSHNEGIGVTIFDQN